MKTKNEIINLKYKSIEKITNWLLLNPNTSISEELRASKMKLRNEIKILEKQ